ncbi:uncharacterized protein FIBRA_04756 [Fibroporia radiculosa]|uniref:CAP-Gly domain-containing protein n=1 Tax=Fibroporia radiculosa TaxID=599839 RepID=J4HWQ1_9APHY|nr:uncharacterized protein FIBRA_04756 [Fibroporia radiculosa]CCM02652.1 predicted protein [Fibroporia radiculosa]
MSSTVNVFVVSPDTRSERRFDLHITVQQLKNKLELITGIPVPNQSISVHNAENDSNILAVLEDENRALGFYGMQDGQVLKVTDLNPSTSFTGQLSDVSQVEKFELSEEAYAQRRGTFVLLNLLESILHGMRTDTVLAYKQRHKIGRFADNEESASTPVPEVNISIGSRCEVETSEEGFHKRGTVRFVGPTKFAKSGTWVGVEYDEPIGKNDGSVQGERYFTCRQNFGVFVRPDRLKIGDFPVEEINFDDEEI